ncbi:hypothetical protein HBZS_111320 [Helicobacter bizzozeronii CCUG 35545]|nr:hypothetical protein HBZS_111320 [Helicobacter bizzozeronii CCUG 35545]
MGARKRFYRLAMTLLIENYQLDVLIGTMVSEQSHPPACLD